MGVLFENQYERTKNFHHEVYMYSLFKRPPMIALYVFLAPVFVLSVLALLFPVTFPYGNNARLYILILIICVAAKTVRYVRTVDISHKRDLEINNGEPVEIKIILTGDGIETCRVNNESKNQISYKSIKKLISTKNYYLLLTEAKHFIVFKKDGFIKGTPDEFLSYIKNEVVKRKKKSKILIALICLVGAAALYVTGSLYMANGRTVFENRAAPTEAELTKIHDIIAFEQAKLSECTELLSRYDGRAEKLGIEIRPELDQSRAVNNQGLVEKHDWNTANWLPKHYGSKIICYVYKGGEKLANRTQNNSISYFVDIYWLLRAGKNTDIVYNENLFDHFDTDISNLLNRVTYFLMYGG